MIFPEIRRSAAVIAALPCFVLVSGCADVPLLRNDPSKQHLSVGDGVSGASGNRKFGVPPKLVRLPLLPPAPTPRPAHELISVVVSDVPLRNLLFALAQDQKINVDIHPGVAGRVTMNATDQTLLQIMERLALQGEIRYQLTGNTLTVVPDTPHLVHYPIDYVSLQRQSKTTLELSGQINPSAGSGGGLNSVTESATQNQFWTSLIQNVCQIAVAANTERDREYMKASEVREKERDERLHIAVELTKAQQGNAGKPGNTSSEKDSADILRQVLGNNSASDRDNSLAKCIASSNSPTTGSAAGAAGASAKSPEILVNRETSQISVFTNSRGHINIRQYLDKAMASARRQVLIEATIVEITLSSGFQQGINWTKLVSDGIGRGLKFQLGPAGSGAFSATQDAAMGVLSYSTSSGDLVGAINLLESFGQTRVLSSPKISVLNNQTAQIKVVDDYVYVTINFTPGTKSTSGGVTTVITPDTYTSVIRTVPVGFVMGVTAQISEADEITLNVRPAISRVIREIEDPNPALRLASPPIINRIPMVQSREMESVMRIRSGEIAVLGGLMQDSSSDGEDGVPGVGRLPYLGSLFKQQKGGREKSELVIFLRPVVVQDASVRGDYKSFKELLPSSETFKKNAAEATGVRALSFPSAQEETQQYE